MNVLKWLFLSRMYCSINGVLAEELVHEGSGVVQIVPATIEE